MRLPIKAQIRT